VREAHLPDKSVPRDKAGVGWQGQSKFFDNSKVFSLRALPGKERWSGRWQTRQLKGQEVKWWLSDSWVVKQQSVGCKDCGLECQEAKLTPRSQKGPAGWVCSEARGLSPCPGLHLLLAPQLRL
jgi:hypothetical protein